MARCPPSSEKIMAQLSRRMGGRSTPNARGNGTGNPRLEAFLTGLLSLCVPTYPESAIPRSFGQTTYYLCPSYHRGTLPRAWIRRS